MIHLQLCSKNLRPAFACCLLATSMLSGALLSAQPVQAAAGKSSLQIFFVDVEGGQATLFLFPDRQSLLIDTGFPGKNERDANRIVKAAKAAGIAKLDYVLFTHYHLDHVGGLPELSAMMPIGTFFDHGENRETAAATVDGYNAYQKLLATGTYKRVIVKAGDKLPIAHTDITVVSADGNVLTHPLPGAGKPNPPCAAPDVLPEGYDPSADPENARSVGIEMNFGPMRILDLGDLTWDHERPLMCPIDNLGHINLLVVSHHASQPSTSPVLIQAIAPQVAISDNGERKGGVARVFDAVRNAPGHPALWQLHESVGGGTQHNTSPDQIANLLSPAGKAAVERAASGAPPEPRPAPGTPRPVVPDDEGYGISVTAQPNGHFTVTNTRNGHSTDYVAR